MYKNVTKCYEFGEDFIGEVGAVVDAFNIINDNSPDSINGTEKSQNVINLTDYREKNRQNDEYWEKTRLAA